MQGFDDLVTTFSTDLERGLDNAEAARRLVQDEPNELRATPPVPT